MGLRAMGVIGDMEAGAQVGYEPDDRAYSTFSPSFGSDTGGGFGKGTTARRAAIIWGASALWLVLVWRAVKGY